MQAAAESGWARANAGGAEARKATAALGGRAEGRVGERGERASRRG